MGTTFRVVIPRAGCEIKFYTGDNSSGLYLRLFHSICTGDLFIKWIEVRADFMQNLQLHRTTHINHQFDQKRCTS